jgi:hypothetical protein
MLLPETRPVETAPCGICGEPAPLPPWRFARPRHGAHPITVQEACLARARARARRALPPGRAQGATLLGQR